MQDFYPSRDDDADDLRHGRDKMRESIKTWMDEWQEQRKILETRNLDEWEAAL